YEDPEEDVTEVVDRAEHLIFEIGQRANALGTEAALAELVTDFMNELEQRAAQRGDIVGVPSGFTDLDRLTGGFQRSDLIIMAARPGAGKTAWALSLAYNAAVHHGQRIGIFSLEMSQSQLVQRLVSIDTGIDTHRLRTGMIEDENWEVIVRATDRLSVASIRIDGTSVLSPTQMRSRARRWVAEHDTSLIIVDYLQLMQSGDTTRQKRENRVLIIDEISRQLKLLARELNIPIVVLAQLSRAVETRQMKVPQLSDLRECVTGDTRVVDAATGRWVSIREVSKGMQVLGADIHQRIRSFAVERVWPTGVKPTHLLTTRTGRQVQATANHPFLTPQGWRRLEQLQAGDVIASALRLPHHGAELEDRAERCRLLGYLVGDGTYQRHREVGFISMDIATMQDACEIVSSHFSHVVAKEKPCHNSQAKQVTFISVYANGYGKPYGNPLREWLRSLGVFGQRDNTKHIPAYVFEAGAVGAREFLAGYLATDGCVKQCKGESHQGMWEMHFDTVSHSLARDVQMLLLRLGIVSSVQPSRYNSRSTQPIYRIAVALTAENLRRCAHIPVRGKKGELLRQMEITLSRDQTNSGLFGLPKEVSRMVALRSRGRTSVPRGMWTGRTWHDQGKRMNREVCQKWAREMDDEELLDWATSDLLWEPIRSIAPAGEAEVFDISVPGCGNFLANGIVAHNSGGIENNADIVMFIYRDELYNPETTRRNVADIIVAKHRNGPTGSICLHYDPRTTRFRDMDDEVVSPFATLPEEELEIEISEDDEN
ncbi:MAG: AAA family ATPase, partial [Chloroflexi bacterium]|nr:AAA family ATPase [Chloroflexota bacterium]